MRLQSVDAFRGLSTLLMIFVDQTGRFFPETIGHSAWNGLHLADVVMPAFLFIVGSSIGLVSARASSQAASPSTKLRRIFRRTAKLFVLGLMTQGASLKDAFFNGYDLESLRICGILQRIALVYCIVASFECFVVPNPLRDSSTMSETEEEGEGEGEGEEMGMRSRLLPVPGYISVAGYGCVGGDFWRKGVEEMRAKVLRRKVQWVVMVVNTVVFTVLTFATPVGVFRYEDDMRNVSVVVKCHTATLDPVCNAARTIDHAILSWSHMFKTPIVQTLPHCTQQDTTYPLHVEHPECVLPFDPEGIFTTFGALLPCQLGLFAALVFSIENVSLRYSLWSSSGVLFIAFGGVIDALGWKFNKQLWSLSYSLCTSGLCSLALAGFHEVLDRTQRGQVVCMPLIWVGCNAILVFVAAATGALEAVLELVYVGDRGNNVVEAYNNAILSVDSSAQKRLGHLLLTLTKMTFWTIVAGLLYKRKWFWKI